MQFLSAATRLALMAALFLILVPRRKEAYARR
jgi:hypothetical protein